MIRFFKNLFKGKDPGPATEAPYKVEAPAAKVEAVNAQPVVVAEVAPAKSTPKAPAKKRTFVKREEGGVAKVAPVKAKAPAKPKAPKAK